MTGGMKPATGGGDFGGTIGNTFASGFGEGFRGALGVLGAPRAAKQPPRRREWSLLQPWLQALLVVRTRRSSPPGAARDRSPSPGVRYVVHQFHP
jgi:hypothetical protein